MAILDDVLMFVCEVDGVFGLSDEERERRERSDVVNGSRAPATTSSVVIGYSCSGPWRFLGQVLLAGSKASYHYHPRCLDEVCNDALGDMMKSIR